MNGPLPVAAPVASPQVRAGRRFLAIGLAVLIVAASAQVTVPIPMNPVPITLQPLAVLIVGGLLGPGAGAAALIVYLALGMLGLPVFAGGSAGFIHVIGPTGGYLLAFPAAAAVAGFASGGVMRTLLFCALAMVVIHLGGTAHLALLGGNTAAAFRIGFVPFLTGDLLKVGLAAGVILGAGPKVRALL